MNLDDVNLEFDLVYSARDADDATATTEHKAVVDLSVPPRPAQFNKAKKDDFEVLKHIGSGAYGKVRPHIFRLYTCKRVVSHPQTWSSIDRRPSNSGIYTSTALNIRSTTGNLANGEV
jgi:hypothetical protein